LNEDSGMVDESQYFAVNTENMEPSDNGAVFDIRENLFFLLTRAYRYVASVCGEEFAPYGITPAQFVVLMHMEGFKSDSQVCLSQKAGIDRTTIVGIIDRLEQKGLVTRTKVPEDRRIRQVALTDGGLKLKNDLCMAAENVHSRLMTKISPKECTDFGRLLAKIREGQTA